MPEQYQLVKRVTFSGKFPLILSAADLLLCRHLVLDVQVSRKPRSAYFSNSTSPSSSFFATMCEMEDDFVLCRHDVTFEKQRVRYSGSDDEQNIPTQICIGKKTTQNLANIATALGSPTIAVNDSYTDALTAPGIFPNKINFCCYADTALTVDVWKLKIEACSEFSQPPQSPQRIPPGTPVPLFQVGTPIPPAQYSPDEGGSFGEYEPFPIDNSAPDLTLPFGDECVPYNVVIEVNNLDNNPQINQYGFNVWGVIQELSLEVNLGNPNLVDVALVCGDQTVTVCTPGSLLRVESGLPGRISGTVVSVTPL